MPLDLLVILERGGGSLREEPALGLHTGASGGLDRLAEKRLEFGIFVNAAQHGVRAADALAYLARGCLGAVPGAFLDGVEHGL